MKHLPLSRGKISIIDDADFDWLSQWKWSCAANGYAVRRKGAGESEPGTVIYLHRVIMGFPTGKEVDHINRNKLDNRRSNLRIADRSLNASNMSAPRRNSSGVVGVQAHAGGWMARIRVGNKNRYLGWFKDIALAIAARNQAETERLSLYLSKEA